MMALAGVAIGVGILAYGSAVVLLACLLFGQIIACKQLGRLAIQRRTLFSMLLAAACTILPTVLWYVYVTHEIGHFHSAEISTHRQIVWIYYAWQDGWGALLWQTLAKIDFFATAFLWQAVPALVSIALISALVAATGNNVRAWFEKLIIPSLRYIAVTALFLGFYIIVGWEAPRLAYSGVGPLIVFLCVIVAKSQMALPGGWSRQTAGAAWLAAISFMAFVVLRVHFESLYQRASLCSRMTLEAA